MSKKNESLESLLQVIPMHLFRLEANGIIVDYHLHHHLPPKNQKTSLTGKNIGDISFIKTSQPYLYRAIQEGIAVTVDYEYRTYKLKASYTPIENDHIALTIQQLPVDTAELKKKSSFKNLTESIALPYFRTNHQGTIVEMGRSVNFALRPEEVVGKNLHTLTSDQEKLKTFEAKIVALSGELAYEQFDLIIEGQHHSLLIGAQANFDHEGNYKGMTGLIQQIAVKETDIDQLAGAMRSDRASMKNKETVIVANIKDGHIIACDNQAPQLFAGGIQYLSKRKVEEVFPQFDTEAYYNFKSHATDEANFLFAQKLKTTEGQYRDTTVSVRSLLIGGGDFCQFTVKDITIDIQRDKIEKLQQDILQRTIAGADVEDLIKYICVSFEEIFVGSYCTYLTYDPDAGVLNSFAASSLPDFYAEALQHVKIGPDVAAWGRAAFIKKMVFMSDILSHPNWKPWLSVMIPTGMKSCWSMPVLTAKGELQGAFAIYYKLKKIPNKIEIKLINQLAHVIGLVVEKISNEQKATVSESRYQNLMDNSPMGILIHTDGEVSFINKYARNLLKIPAHKGLEMIPASFIDLIKNKISVDPNGNAAAQEENIIDSEGLSYSVIFKARKVNFGGEEAIKLVFHDITQRKKTQTALQKSQELFQLAIAGSSAGIWDWHDIEEGKIWWAPKIYDLLHYDHNGFQPTVQQAVKMIHPTDRKRVMTRLNSYLKHDGALTVEFRIMDANGAYRWFFCSGKAQRDKKGKAIRLVGSLVDIDDQKRGQQQLKSREMLLNRTGMLGKIGGWELELDSMQLTWTDQVFYIHEIELGTPPGVDQAIHFYHPDDRPQMEEAIKGCIEGKPYDIKLRLITAKKNEIWVRTSGYPIFKNKKVTKIAGAFQDITDSELQQRNILESQRKLELTNKIAKIGHWQWDMDNNSVYWSAELYHILGAPQEQKPGMEFFESVIHTNDQAKYADFLLQSMKNESLEARDLSIVDATTGEVKHISIRSVNIQNETGSVVRILGTVQDITARKRMEVSLNSQNKYIKVLHHLSQLSVRANNNWFLIHEFCKALIDEFEYDWIWVSSQENLKNNQTWPEAHYVRESYQRNDHFNELLRLELNGPLNESFQKGKSIVVKDIDQVAKKYPEWYEHAKKLNIQSSIYLPYYHGDTIKGTINIYTCVPSDVGDERLAFLRQFADKLGSSTYALELKKHKEELNDFNKLLVDSLHVASARMDRHNGQIVFTGDTEALVGYTEKELVGLMTDLKNHVHANDFKKINRELDLSRENNGYFNFDFKFRNKNGRYIWINTIGKTYWQFNSIRKIVGILINTDEKKTEEMNLMKAQIVGRDKERERIAQQLHDGLGQMLTVCGMGLSTLKKDIVALPDERKDIFFEALDTLNGAIEDTRALSHELMPSKVRRGLEPAINSLVNRLRKNTDIEFNVFFHETEKRYDSEIETNLYYIISEILNNILKHSGAHKVDIQLIEIDHMLVLMIADDGVGFNVDHGSSEEGIGLSNIKSRVLSINGEIDIETEKGTQFIIEIRLESDRSHDNKNNENKGVKTVFID